MASPKPLAEWYLVFDSSSGVGLANSRELVDRALDRLRAQAAHLIIHEEQSQIGSSVRVFTVSSTPTGLEQEAERLQMVKPPK